MGIADIRADNSLCKVGGRKLGLALLASRVPAEGQLSKPPGAQGILILSTRKARGVGEGLKLIPAPFGCLLGLGEDILGWRELTDSLSVLSLSQMIQSLKIQLGILKCHQNALRSPHFPGLEQGRDLAKVTKPSVPELAANQGAPPSLLYPSGLLQ